MRRVTANVGRDVLTRVLLLAAFGTLARGAIADAQSKGTFGPTGDMTSARSFHTATLLSNGEVLIAGGVDSPPAPPWGSGTVLATAELYDPGAGTFRATSAMTTPRRLHTATLLPDERVLIVGGYGEGGTALASAELFDPARGTFTAAGSLTTPRGGHSAILLPTGAVLIIGGYDTRAYPDLASAEVYDPAAGVFRAAGVYVGRGGCDSCAPAVLLRDGTVLFTGQNPAQLYDPLSDSFTASGAMRTELSAAAPLASGQVLFAGGESLGRSANAELYNPATHTFAPAANMTAPRIWHTLTSLPDGTVLAVGGETDFCSGNACYFAGSVASAELYDPSAGVFVPTADMAVARSTHTATLLGDGRVLIAGGVSYGGIGIFRGALAGAELYTPVTSVPGPVLVSLAGERQGLIFHAGTRHLVTADDPAATDEEIEIVCSGLADTTWAPQVAIGGRLAALLSITPAPERAGANQVHVRVPSGIVAAPTVTVRLFQMGRPSNDVTIAIR